MGRVKHVEGLRAIAVLLVVAHHATTHSSFVANGYVGLARLTVEGSHGVDLFFILSGFCLSYPVLRGLADNGTSRFDICGYLARRCVRIVPPYYAAIAIFALIPALTVPWPDIARQAFFLDWNTRLLNGSFWSLCVEFRWYFFFPLALALWVRLPRAFLAVAFSACAAYSATRMRALDLGVLLPFLLGIVAAALFIRPHRWLRYVWILFPLFTLIGFVLEPHITVQSAFGQELQIFFEQTNVGWQLAMFALVVMIGYDANLARLFAVKPLLWIGAISYSVYLVHEPLIRWIDSSMNASLPVTILVAMVVSIGAGALFWFVFERPWYSGRLRTWTLERLEVTITRSLLFLDLPKSFALRSWRTLAVEPLPIVSSEASRMDAKQVAI